MRQGLKVGIRVDSSVHLGSGHIMRCLSLAEELVDRGAHVSFLCRTLSEDQVQAVARRECALYRLPPRAANSAASVDQSIVEDRDGAECAALLSTVGKLDWLVVDHYGLGMRWETGLRACAAHIMAIDDLANRPHDCDLLLDQNLSDADDRYRDLVGENSRLLIGPRYALLRREFQTVRPRSRDGSVKRMLVFFGGADASNQTTKALQAVQLLGRPDVGVDVVVGSMNPNAAEIEAQSRQMPQCQVHRDADMATLMNAADLAIGAGGITTWERCAMGLPSIAWPVADNQRSGLTALARREAVCVPAPESIATADDLMKQLHSVIDNPTLLRLMSRRAREVCDGRGAARVVDAMLIGDISVRPATKADCRLVYEWRNHPDIRRASLCSTPIEWEQHQVWFERALERDDRMLLIGLDGGRAIGVVRFDILEVRLAEISIYVDPQRLHRGFGPVLLRESEDWLRRRAPRGWRVIAKVRADNTASHRLFERGGYRREDSAYTKELTA